MARFADVGSARRDHKPLWHLILIPLASVAIIASPLLIRFLVDQLGEDVRPFPEDQAAIESAETCEELSRLYRNYAVNADSVEESAAAFDMVQDRMEDRDCPVPDLVTD
jgi:hypothetical protein